MMKNNLSILEKTFIKTGTVLAVRAWEPATFFEVDVHLPRLDMHTWHDAQHIKCKVAPFTYRDYTPAWWDAETHTCTLFIDAAHDGAGSKWVKTLQQGQPFYYIGASSSHQAPVGNVQHVLLGDQTAIGHFAALQQLAGKTANITGAVAIQQTGHQYAFKEYLGKLPLDTVGNLSNWLQGNKAETGAIFYLAGNAHIVVSLRKQLRAAGYGGHQIKAEGFWH